MKALGMIEVYGRIGAIEGLDTALKSANVSIVNLCKVGGGLTTIFFEGDVGAVKAATDSGVAAAERVGKLISSHVIPRPAESTRVIVAPVWEHQKAEEIEVVQQSDTSETEVDEETLKKLNIHQLRELAKGIPDIEMTPKDITFAKKEVIINAIMKRKGER